MGRHRGRAPNLHWTGFDASSQALSAGASASTIFAAVHGTETGLRIRGNLMAYVDGTQAPGGGVVVGVGLILVPEGTGSTVLWSPMLDRDAPWWYYASFNLGYEEMVSDVIDVPGITSYRETIDVKAMRIRRNQEVQFVVESQTTASTMDINVFISGRLLAQE